MTNNGMRVLVVDDAVEYARMVAELVRAEAGSAVVDIADSYHAALQDWLGSQPD